ncbi:hypothetical protein BgiBS90_012267 [Biomphalaria glabrata]|nr:hypothetical protein BgiBS90_012267 [Biomphalaria glabrata]
MKNICDTHGRIGVIGRWTSVRVWKPVVKSRMLLMVMVVSSVSPSHGPMAILMSVSNVHHLKSSITSAADFGDRRPYLSRTYFVSISHPHRIYLKLYTNSGNSFFQVCPSRSSLVVRADKSFKQIIGAVKGQDKRRTNPYDHVQKSLKHCPPGTLKTSVDGGNRFASFDRYSMDVNVNKIHPTLYKFSATSPTPLRCAENNGWSLGQQDRTTRESSMGGYASPRLECSLIQQTSLVFV